MSDDVKYFRILNEFMFGRSMFCQVELGWDQTPVKIYFTQNIYFVFY